MKVLIQGDCLVEIPKLAQRFRLVLADLPYGITACDWDTPIDLVKFWEVVKPILTEDGSVVMFGSQPFTTDLISSNRKMFKYCWIWSKEQRGGGFLNSKKRPLSYHEDICVFQKKLWYNPQMIKGKKHTINSEVRKKASVYGKVNIKLRYETDLWYPITILSYRKITHGHHPTEKPTGLLEYLIKTYTNEEDWVLDPTMGSGSCGVACRNMNRNFVGIELDATYFQICQGRV